MDCIEVLCKKLEDHVLKIINYEKKKKKEKEITPLSEEENKSNEKQNVCHISKKKKVLFG